MPNFHDLNAFKQALVASTHTEIILYPDELPEPDLIPESERDTFIHAITQNTTLKTLKINHLQLDTSIMDALGHALSENKLPLKRLFLSECGPTITEVFAEGLRLNTSLEILELSEWHNPIEHLDRLYDALDARTPENGSANTTLETLKIADTTALTDDEVAMLALKLGSTNGLKRVEIASVKTSDWGEQPHYYECFLWLSELKRICHSLSNTSKVQVFDKALSGIEPYANQMKRPTPENTLTAHIKRARLPGFMEFFEQAPHELTFITGAEYLCDELESQLKAATAIETSDKADYTLTRTDGCTLSVKVKTNDRYTWLSSLKERIDIVLSSCRTKAARSS